ncbi:hypothetical protein PVIIG_01784 [Plasmodium vivax India VII]|uniref:Uncharacterized protein n=4 Tax=Plasmodium vivax TaxID=5855 RepID=A0A0J9TQS1_PLAVI|nr:hypothetical protein PVIIG_01784 [Plasmodium vivax India VII]KMZ85453.1 hypothetical protein PVBG_02139 [Plasmodium vivax Brazil I]KMZ98170.1 hypothetical protein PVNG_00507 [Plasmodium vivax North Korean]
MKKFSPSSPSHYPLAAPCRLNRWPPKKDKQMMEQDAGHLLMKELEILYNIRMMNSVEILLKEIELLKKQIEQLQEQGGTSEGGSLGHLLKNEATKKTIFGVNEDDLGNYETASLPWERQRWWRGSSTSSGQATQRCRK